MAEDKELPAGVEGTVEGVEITSGKQMYNWLQALRELFGDEAFQTKDAEGNVTPPPEGGGVRPEVHDFLRGLFTPAQPEEEEQGSLATQEKVAAMQLPSIDLESLFTRRA